MGHAYDDDDTAFPSAITIPDNGNALNASSVNVAFEPLADRTAYLYKWATASKCVPVRTEFLTSGTITIPANALPWVHFVGCGGGGAGGRGGIGVAAAKILCGGGGGGGSWLNSGEATVVPGDTYNVGIGAGGSGYDLLFGFGQPGGDTFLQHQPSSAGIVVCRGAAGGQSGYLGTIYDAVLMNAPYAIGGSDAGGNQCIFARGGSPVRPFEVDGLIAEPPAGPTFLSGSYYNNTPGAGGLGSCSTYLASGLSGQGVLGFSGMSSPQGFTGGRYGAQGTHNADAADRLGGGSGGGGGAGPFGFGGAGGAGSHATGSLGPATAGGTGTTPAANSGAGGGGGGGAGSGTTTAAGGTPGNGGSGRFYLTYFIPVTG